MTIDQNLEHQQNLEGAELAIVVLQSRSSRFDALLPIVPRLLAALDDPPRPGEIVRIGT